MIQFIGKRFLEEHQNQRKHKEDHNKQYSDLHISCTKCSKDRNGHTEIKDKSGDGIGAEQHIFTITKTLGIDDIEDHADQNQEHTEDNGTNQYGVDASDARQCHLVYLRQKPDRFEQYAFKAEEGTEQKAEDRREQSCTTDDSRQTDVLEVIQQKSADQKAETLTEIAVHRTEDKGIGQCNEQCRVELAVIRETVHLHIHLIRLKQLRIFQLCRRYQGLILCIDVLYDTDNHIVICDLLHQLLHIILCHPSAENIVFIVFVQGTRRILSNVEVLGQTLQVLLGGQKNRAVLLEDGQHLLLNTGNLLLLVLNHTKSALIALLRCSFTFRRNVETLKMHRGIHRIDLMRLISRNEIDAPDIAFVLLTRIKDRIEIIVDVVLQLMVEILRNAAEAEFYELVSEQLANVCRQGAERLKCVGTLLQLLDFTEQASLLRLQCLHLVIQSLCQIRSCLGINSSASLRDACCP